jgi:hypothetical protein
MIYISIGIAMLAIGSIVLTHRQTQIELDKEYRRGFEDGAEAILDKKYKTLSELEQENEKD